MSQPQSAVTYEGVLELIRKVTEQMKVQTAETDRKIQETADQIKETADQIKATDLIVQKTADQIKATDRKISALGSRVGEIVENMVGGDIVGQFRALGYAVTAYCRNKIFGEEGTSESGEIDLLLEDGDIAILIEVKTTLRTADVLGHIERLEKYRSHINKNGDVDRRQFIGAVAGASVAPDVIKFAQRKGLYVIVQAGRTVEILSPPVGFVAKKW
jgi:hypothetical protein